MINERMTFCPKYGKEDAAVQRWSEMINSYPESSAPREIKSRLYHALTSRTNTVVQDFLIKSINDHNPMMYYWVTNTQVQEFYRKFVEYCDCSVREMFKIEHETGDIKEFKNLIVERNTFRLVFGKAKTALLFGKRSSMKPQKPGDLTFG